MARIKQFMLSYYWKSGDFQTGFETAISMKINITSGVQFPVAQSVKMKVKLLFVVASGEIAEVE